MSTFSDLLTIMMKAFLMYVPWHSRGTSTIANCRPDFLLWIGDILLFWGEEKADSGAKGDLINKYNRIDPVTFGDIRFMICYTANGPKIRFYAVDGSAKDPDPFVPLTNELDLATFPGRFEVLRTTINIARILVTIKDGLPAVAYPLAKRIKIGNSEITFNLDCVEKKTPVTDLPYCQPSAQERCEFLWRMYKHAQGHRGLVQVKDGPKLNGGHTHYVVTLMTRGLKSRPKNERELQGMTKDLVCGLVWLHNESYLHRDIRLPNITYDPIKKQYVLIDFEHACQERRRGRSTKPAIIGDDTVLKEWDSRTLSNGIYSKASDMYQLGKLLKTDFGSMILSEWGRNFLTSLEEKQMTATQALQHDWICALP
jgi:hypothetical protein